MSDLHRAELLLEALSNYRNDHKHYDEVLAQVGARVRRHEEASKLDLAALVCWKQVGQGDWVSELMETSDFHVRYVTRRVLAARTDQGRLDVLAELPGFDRDDVLATVFLAAYKPEEYSVLDQRSLEGLRDLGCPVATGAGQTVRYFDRVRELRDLVRDSGSSVTARNIDQALWIIGGS